MSGTTNQQLPERSDIHKSCRTIESLINVLSDYCEAAGAIVALQKKLVKALRETAGLKTTSEIAANALTASANIFEALAEVDSKFIKLADKECDNVTSEVKKWFKKLNKEERNHDERMSDANARIKQAGQTYEKKSKRSARDAGEEHTRYVNLLSVLGPEMSQERYNHSLLVNQRHSSTTYGVAASLSRVADAEWMRTCEHIRRLSPTVGPLGENRALCEGNWMGPLPDDLPNQADVQDRWVQETLNHTVTEWGQTINSGSQHSTQQHALHPPGGQSSSSSSAPPTFLDRPRPAFSNVDHTKDSINSITTLSAFPFPPTHFPVPPVRSEADVQRPRAQVQTLQFINPAQAGDVVRSFSESPKAIAGSLFSGTSTLAGSSKSPSSIQNALITSSAAPQVYLDSRSSEKLGLDVISSDGKLPTPTGSSNIHDAKAPVQHRRRSLVDMEKAASSGSVPEIAPLSQQTKSQSAIPEHDFGVAKEFGHSGSQFKSKSVDLSRAGVERMSSTTSNGSLVAAMRNRYTRVGDSSTPPPKDIPRLPLGVPDLASRYQPAEGSLSPRKATNSSTNERRQTLDNPPQDRNIESPRSSRIKSTDDDEQARRQGQLTELGFKEKEYELKQREHEVNQRTRELERDRAKFLAGRLDSSGFSDSPRGHRSSHPYPNPSQSYSATHLAPPSASPSSFHQQYSHSSQSASQSQSQPSSPLPNKDHAPFCGCDTCSVTKYKSGNVSPSPYDLRPPEPPIKLRPEKPKGWIRRLSMPAVSGAFSLDAKKNASATSLKTGLPMPVENGRLRKRSFDQGISNRSVGNVRRR